jgi:hypothetical protein
MLRDSRTRNVVGGEMWILTSKYILRPKEQEVAWGGISKGHQQVVSLNIHEAGRRRVALLCFSLFFFSFPDVYSGHPPRW